MTCFTFAAACAWELTKTCQSQSHKQDFTMRALSSKMSAAIEVAAKGVASRLAVERERAASEFRTALQKREHAGAGVSPQCLVIHAQKSSARI